jgi:hypothetical protein
MGWVSGKTELTILATCLALLAAAWVPLHSVSSVNAVSSPSREVLVDYEIRTAFPTHVRTEYELQLREDDRWQKVCAYETQNVVQTASTVTIDLAPHCQEGLLKGLYRVVVVFQVSPPIAPSRTSISRSQIFTIPGD